MQASIECALARVTTGEWGEALRGVFGEHQAQTGVAGQSLAVPALQGQLAARIASIAARTGRRPRLLLGKPGLDGHSNGAEMIAIAARDAGFEVVYGGIRSTPGQLAAVAEQESVDLVGLSILSGSHLELCQELVDKLAAKGLGQIPLVVGGIIPTSDLPVLEKMGVRRVFTPADFELGAIVESLLQVFEETLSD
jgi:(2R)-ethylmalonyl-CoA mutase